MRALPLPWRLCNWLVPVVAIAAVSCSSGNPKPSGGQPGLEAPRGERTESAKQEGAVGSVLVGEEIYTRKCAPCHGPVDGPTGSNLSDAAWHSEDAVLESIRQGGGGDMPSFANRLPDALLRDVVRYLKFAGAR